jgi:hypothetical protein
LEWFYYRLRGLALFDLLELAGRTTVLVVAILWLFECNDRAKERHYRAWELINAARGSSGDGGRRDALEDLNRDGVSLAAAPLEKAWLPEVDLERAALMQANLQGANLEGASLRGANLISANLEGANLNRAKLEGANLFGANLKGTDFWDANMDGAILWRANMEGAALIRADLEGANLFDASLKDAKLWGANLKGAVLGDGGPWADTWLMYRVTTGLEPEDVVELENTISAAKVAAARWADLGEAPERQFAQEQLNRAEGDDRTQLPDGLTRPGHWIKAAPLEPAPAVKPDAARIAPNAAGESGQENKPH